MTFLLEQHGHILSAASKPSVLPYSLLDPLATWAVLAASEDGGRHILGPVVTFRAKPGAPFYRLTSRLDGCNRLIGHAGTSIDLLFDRIRVQENNGEYDNWEACKRTELWEVYA